MAIWIRILVEAMKGIVSGIKTDPQPCYTKGNGNMDPGPIEAMKGNVSGMDEDPFCLSMASAGSGSTSVKDITTVPQPIYTKENGEVDPDPGSLEVKFGSGTFHCFDRIRIHICS